MTITALRASVEAHPVCPVACLQLRAWARCYMYRAGMLSLGDAVDVLQADAVASGLVDDLGQDAVQEIFAAEFTKVRHVHG